MIPFLDSVPTMVTIHSEIAPANAGNSRSTIRRSEEHLEIAQPGARHRVTTIDHRVNGDACDALVFGHRHQCEQMLLVCVHTAVTDKADEMQCAAGFLPARILQRRDQLLHQGYRGEILQEPHALLEEASMQLRSILPHLV